MFDDIDVKILNEFLKITNNKTTWEIMKQIYPKGRDTQHNLVKRRIEKMADRGLFLINGESTKHYRLISDFVKKGKIKFNKKPKECILISVYGKWSAYEL